MKNGSSGHKLTNLYRRHSAEPSAAGFKVWQEQRKQKWGQMKHLDHHRTNPSSDNPVQLIKEGLVDLDDDNDMIYENRCNCSGSHEKE
jgi:hypothetical protein